MLYVQGQENPLASLLANFAGGATTGYVEKKENQKNEKKLQTALANLKEDSSPLDILKAFSTSGLDPAIQKTYLDMVTAEKAAKKKADSSQGGAVEDQKSFDIIKNRFGEKNAKLWQSATEGGKTQLLKNFLENEERGGNLQDQMGNQETENQLQQLTQIPGAQQTSQNIPQPVVNMGQGSAPASPQLGKADALQQLVKALPKEPKTEPEFKYPSLPKERLTSKERVKSETEREKTNTPIYKEAADKARSLNDDLDTIELLENLDDTDQLPKGSGRITIDNKTGDLIFPAAETPETQVFYKTLQRFNQKAKDFYPGRVTNFDLDTFKKSLPSLANDKEGRKLIYKQMKLAYEMNALDEQSIVDTFDHFGISKGSYPEIAKRAKLSVKDKRKQLSERMKTLDGEISKRAKEREYKKPSKGKIRMRNPEDGSIWGIDTNKVKDAEADKWTIVE